MLIPAVAIHEAVHAVKVLLVAAAARPRLGAVAVGAARSVPWLPTVVGLLLIPALPLADEPVHHLLKWSRMSRVAAPAKDGPPASRRATALTTSALGRGRDIFDRFWPEPKERPD